MSRSLATDSLSITGGGAALVTDPAGSIEPTAVAGFFVEDLRVLSEWHIDPAVTAQLVGRVRLGPSSDRLISTLSAAGTIDPVAKFERTRTITGDMLREELAISAYVRPLTCTLRLHAARDDRSIFEIGDGSVAVDLAEPIVGATAADRFTLRGPAGGAGRDDRGAGMAPRGQSAAHRRLRRTW